MPAPELVRQYDLAQLGLMDSEIGHLLDDMDDRGLTQADDPAPRPVACG